MSDPSDVTPAPEAPARATTAGGILRQARQAQGLHIAALAAAIKVVPQKLEWLEADQFDKLPDATFTRALAQTVCRTLKIDAAPVLSLLPKVVHAYRLEEVAEGLKTPFNERPGRLVPKDWATVTTPVLWIAALIVVLTVAVYVLPSQWLPFSLGGMARLRPADGAGSPASTVTTTIAPGFPPAASGADADAATPPAADASEPAPAAAPNTTAQSTAPVVVAPDTPVAAATPVPAASAVPAPTAATAATAATGALQFRTTEPAWIGVVDAHGKSLMGRLVQPGENVGIDGDMPLKVTVGNANHAQVVFRGQPVPLAARTRDNVARIELK